MRFKETRPGYFEPDLTPEEKAAGEERIRRWRQKQRLRMAKEDARRAMDYYLELRALLGEEVDRDERVN